MSATENSKTIIQYARLAVIIIVTLWLANLFILLWVDSDTRGTFGDMFGAANALFSGLALAGVILSILLQREELIAQREELGLTRKEFKDQNKTLKIQSETLYTQQFESSLFHMISLFNDLRSRIYHKKTHNRADKVCFEIENEIRAFSKKYMDQYNIKKDEIMPGLLASYFYKASPYAKTALSSYFSMIIAITDHIIDFQLQEKSEKYKDVFRSIFSEHELFVIYYLAFGQQDIEKIKSNIEKVGLFINMDMERLIGYASHLSFYNDSAYLKEELN